MHLCLGIVKDTNHIYPLATRNSEIGMTGRHPTAAESFSKQELKPISTTQTLFFLCKI